MTPKDEMIQLTRLSGHEFWLNSDLIESMEATPDTVLTLVDGRRIVVQEPPQIVSQMCVTFRASVLLAAGANPLDDAKVSHGALAAVGNAHGGMPKRDVMHEAIEPSAGHLKEGPRS